MATQKLSLSSLSVFGLLAMPQTSLVVYYLASCPWSSRSQYTSVSQTACWSRSVCTIKYATRVRSLSTADAPPQRPQTRPPHCWGGDSATPSRLPSRGAGHRAHCAVITLVAGARARSRIPWPRSSRRMIMAVRRGLRTLLVLLAFSSLVWLVGPWLGRRGCGRRRHWRTTMVLSRLLGGWCWGISVPCAIWGEYLLSLVLIT